MRYSRGALQFNFFTNILNGDASALLAIGTDGQPIPFDFHTQTYDVELGNVNTIGTRQVISYGGNFRFNNFDLSIAPLGSNRTEAGFYVQDEFFLHDKLRFNFGARLDKFDVIDDPVFSPRVALIIKPLPDHAIRVSYNKAFRSPSLINNYPRGRHHQSAGSRADQSRVRGAAGAPVQLPGGTRPATRTCAKSRSRPSRSATPATSGTARRCRPRSTSRATKTRSSSRRSGRYRALPPPPGWLQALPILPPAQALGILEVLPPPCPSLTAPCTTGGLPSEFSYRNLGVNRNKGFEFGVDGAATAGAERLCELFVPGRRRTRTSTSRKSTCRRRTASTSASTTTHGRFLGNVSVSYVDDAFFQDVLDARFHGPDRGLHAGQRRRSACAGRRGR